MFRTFSVARRLLFRIVGRKIFTLKNVVGKTNISMKCMRKWCLNSTCAGTLKKNNPSYMLCQDGMIIIFAKCVLKIVDCLK